MDDDEDDNCSICLEEIIFTNTYTSLISCVVCHKSIHKTCYNVGMQFKCPSCRSNYVANI